MCLLVSNHIIEACVSLLLLFAVTALVPDHPLFYWLRNSRRIQLVAAKAMKRKAGGEGGVKVTLGLREDEDEGIT